MSQFESQERAQIRRQTAESSSEATTEGGSGQAPSSVAHSVATLQQAGSTVARQTLMGGLQAQGNQHVSRVAASYNQVQRQTAEAAPDAPIRDANGRLTRQGGNVVPERLLANGQANPAYTEANASDANSRQAREGMEGGQLSGDAHTEQIARDYGYRAMAEGQLIPGQAGGNPPAYIVVSIIDDPKTGLQAFAAVPAGANGKADPNSKAAPIVAFRGTEFGRETRQDLLGADMASKSQVGHSQFNGTDANGDSNRDAIERMFQATRQYNPEARAVVTGHSLGGALAQTATVQFPEYVQNVVTFNAPGASQDEYNTFQQQKKEHGITATGYVHEKDIVSQAGHHNLADRLNIIHHDPNNVGTFSPGRVGTIHNDTYLWNKEATGTMTNDDESKHRSGILGKTAEFLRHHLGGGVAKLGNKVLDGIELFKKVKGKITDGINWAKDTFNTVKERVTTGINWAKDTFNNVKDRVKGGIEKAKGIIGSIKNKVTGVIEKAKGMASDVRDKIVGKATQVLNQAKSQVSQTIQKAKNAYSGVKQKVQKGIEKAKSVFTGIKDKAKSAVDKVKGVFNSTKDKVKSGIAKAKNLFTSTKQKATNAVNSAKQTLQKAKQKVQAGVTNVVSKIKGKAQEAKQAAVNKAKQVYNQVKQKVQAKVTQVKAKVAAVKQKVTSTIQKAKATYAAAKQKVTSTVAAAKQKVQAVTNRVSTAVSGAKQKVQSAANKFTGAVSGAKQKAAGFFKKVGGFFGR